MEYLEPRLLLSGSVNESPMYVVFHNGARINPAAVGGISGLTPTQIRQAYGISGISDNGSGQTIAIIDAYAAPTIVSDLHSFDVQFGLPDPILTQINQSGGSTLPGVDPSGKGNSWAVETSLDVEWAHVVAPQAHILLVEASSDSASDLYAAVNTARNYAGVSVVSMSWGGAESSSDVSQDSLFTTPAGHIGVTFLAASGDTGGYNPNTGAVGVIYPAASPNVISVGGSTLATDSAGDYLGETGWGNGTRSFALGGSGGGLSTVESQPSYQHGVVTQSSTRLALPDVSMLADPATGVPVIDSYDFGAASPWVQVGGTSLATPLWAGVITLADQAVVAAGGSTLNGATQTLPKLFALRQDFHDITSGSNGPYSAGAGFDLVTGLGTPIVNELVPALAGTTPTPTPTPTPTSTPTIGALHLSGTTVTAGTSVAITAQNVSDTGATISSVAFYREVTSAGPQPILDQFIGYGTASGANWSVTFSTTSLSAGTYTLYAIATDSAGNTSAAATAVLTVQSATPAPTPTPPATNAPVIGSLTATPSPVTVGSRLTLTATAVTDATAPVRRVAFYRELNPASGPQPNTDHFIGDGYQAGANWMIVASTSTIAPGTYTLYAIATDARGNVSSPAITQVTVKAAPAPGVPTIGTLQASSSSIPEGQNFTLTISNVTVPSNTQVTIALYTESNPSAGPQPGSDYLIGYAVWTGSTLSLVISTRGASPGAYTIYAIATDAYGQAGAPVSVTIDVTAARSRYGGRPYRR